jgi:predicted O-methyltransferase YrrM
VNDLFRKVVDNPYPYYSPGYPAWNLLYYVFTCVCKPSIENVVLETGTCYGLSTIVMAQAMKDFDYKGKIYTIEIKESNIKRAEKNFEETDLSSYIQVILGDSKIILLDLLSTFSRLDFVFLDGNHSEDAVYTEFNLVKSLIRKSDGYIYFDNVSSGGVYEALQKIKYENPGGNLVIFPNCSWSPPGQAIWSF